MDYLEIQMSSQPEQKEAFDSLIRSYQQKLWHQLGETLLNNVLKNAFFLSEKRLIEMNDKFVSKIKDHLAPLLYARFIIATSAQYPDAQASVTLLESVLEGLDDDVQASVMCNIEICRRKLALGQLDDAKEILDTQEARMNTYSGILPSLIHSHYFLASLEYFKAKGPAASYYKASLLYLTYTPLDTLELPQQVSLAYDVALAALVGHKVYNFGELLQHPIIKTLQGTAHEWLYELVNTFNAGDIDKAKAIFAQKGDSQTTLVSNLEFLQQKIRIMACMEMVFRKDAHSRVISFEEISKHCDLPVAQVEWLLMKAFSLEVLKGKIDQVEQKVRIHWVQPRVLGIDQVKSMRDKISNWSAQVKASATYVEEQAPELLAH